MKALFVSIMSVTVFSSLAASAFDASKSGTEIIYKIPKYKTGRVFSEPIKTFDNLLAPLDPNILTNDPLIQQQWAIKNFGQTKVFNIPGKIGADIGIEYAWKNNFIGSKDVIVAIVDSGIDLNHPDLKANIYVNPKEILNGRDDDGNGYVDDISGWDFFNNTNRAQDELGHGTHVAGIIGAVGNNGVGITGVNQHVSILPLKFMDKNGRGNERGAAAAVNYAVKMGATIINASWGGESDGVYLRAAIQAAQAKGILFVAASGNEGYNTDSYPSYPSNYAFDNVISVTSVDALDHFASFTNYGPRSVHIAAPGENILSTAVGSKYVEMSGTSMATPYISGALALLKSIHPTWNYLQLKNELLKYAEVIPSTDRMVASHGRLNIESILTQTKKTYTPPDESLWKTMDLIQETKHPYDAQFDQLVPIRIPGAKYIRVIFEKIDLADNVDRICMTSRLNGIVECISGQKSNYTTQFMLGDIVFANIITNETKQGWGFKIQKVQYID